MSEEFQYDKLVLLNNIYHNTLSEPKQPFQKPDSITSPLYPHQSTMAHGMHQYREKMTRGFMVGNQAINGKIGIIGDPPGTGKTLSVLAYLAAYPTIFPRMTSELTSQSSTYFFSHEIQQLSDRSTNLIIVPHSLFNQWRNEINQHTTLSYVAIETKRNTKGDQLAKDMINSQFVITTNKCYKFVQEYAKQHEIQWDNIIIDEASSIYIRSSDPPLQFQFLWLVTNNWIPLLFKHPSIVKSSLFFLRDRVNLHPDLENWLLDQITVHYNGTLISSYFLRNYLPFLHRQRGSIVLRNASNLIESSIQLPDMNHHILSCRPNITLQSLSSFYLVKNMEPTIRSRSIPHLFQALHIECTNVDSYLSRQLESKHKLIKRKLEENECVICMETCEYPSMVNCCYNLYCGKCLLRNTILSFKCPTCRSGLSTSNISCISELRPEDIVLSKNKMEICLDLCKNHTDRKFIIYSAFDNIYYQLFEEINKAGLKAERIENNLFSLLKTIRNFQEGKTNVLFISNIETIRGLSLPSTTHLIFYHELPVFELKQVLIHSCQRLGRTQPLQIYHLNSEIPV
jgi:SNF2 family DNA or RNA helicase